MYNTPQSNQNSIRPHGSISTARARYLRRKRRHPHPMLVGAIALLYVMLIIPVIMALLGISLVN